jgi:hypothetical protein
MLSVKSEPQQQVRAWSRISLRSSGDQMRNDGPGTRVMVGAFSLGEQGWTGDLPMRVPVSIALATAISASVLPTGVGAQLQQRQDATVATGVVPVPAGPSGVPAPAPFAAATVRTFTYQPVCEIRREQFSDETGWRVRDVRICY